MGTPNTGSDAWRSSPAGGPRRRRRRYHLQPAVTRGVRVVEQRSGVRWAETTRRSWAPQPVERLAGVPHRLPVRARPHDHAHQRPRVGHGADTTLPLVSEAGQASDGRGLTEAEAQTRLARRGEREPLPSSRTVKGIVRENTLTLFNLILVSFFVVLLIAGDPADGLFLGIVVANSAIGIIQEVRAKRTLDRAALLVAPRARVVRGGEERDVAPDAVADGDLVRVRAGDQVVADGVVTEAAGLDAGRVAADRRVGAGASRRGRAGAVRLVRGRGRRPVRRRAAPATRATPPGCSARPARTPASGRRWRADRPSAEGAGGCDGAARRDLHLHADP